VSRTTDNDGSAGLHAVPETGAVGAPDAGPSREPTGDRPDAHGAMCIDCDECVMQGTSACDDCVVTFVCSREPGEALVVDVAEERALRLLSEAGLLPELRHVRRTG
jgi:hypothetical protein